MKILDGEVLHGDHIVVDGEKDGKMVANSVKAEKSTAAKPGKTTDTKSDSMDKKPATK